MKKIVICLFIMLAINANAASEQLSGKTITKITAYEDFLFVYYTPSEPVSQGCDEDDNGTRAVIDNANNKSTEMVSAALTAATAGKTVTIGVQNCYGGNNDKYIKIYRIEVNF